MLEAPAAREAFARVFAIDHAVEIGEIIGAVAFAGAGPCELPRIGSAFFTRSGVAGWRRQKIERARIGASLPGVFRSALRCMSVRKREAPNESKPARAEMPTPMPSASNSCAREKLASVSFDFASASAPVCGSLSTSLTRRADDRGLPRLLLADGGVARNDVAHFMRQHGGEFGFVIGERDQPARNIKVAVRQRESIDRRRVEDGNAIFQIGPFRRRDQTIDGLFDGRLQPRVLIDAAIGGEDARMFALRQRLGFVGRGRVRHRQRDLPVRRYRGAGGKPQHAQHGDAAPHIGHRRNQRSPRQHQSQHQSTNSICSGAAASMIGPPRRSIQPRTLIRRPSSCFTSRPAAANVRCWRLRRVTVKSRVQRRPKFM